MSASAVTDLLILYQHANLATKQLQLACDSADEDYPDLRPEFDALADEFHRVATELQRLERALERTVERAEQLELTH